MANLSELSTFLTIEMGLKHYNRDPREGSKVCRLLPKWASVNKKFSKVSGGSNWKFSKVFYRLQNFARTFADIFLQAKNVFQTSFVTSVHLDNIVIICKTMQMFIESLEIVWKVLQNLLQLSQNFRKVAQSYRNMSRILQNFV